MTTEHVHELYVWRMRGPKVRCKCEHCDYTTGWIPNYVHVRKTLYSASDLNAMKREELIALAQQHQIHVMSKATKQQVIEQLLEVVT